MDDIMRLSTSTSVLQTAFTVGIGLVITVVYLTRRRKNTGKSKTENNSNHNSVSSKSLPLESGHVTTISEEKSRKEKDLEKEIQECQNLIATLERQIEFERSKRNESESWCSSLEKELQTERKMRQEAEVKHDKLLKRYEVISLKLKAAEERCKKLIHELNNVDSDVEENDSLEEDDDDVDDDVDEVNGNDDDISYDETPPVTPEVKASRVNGLNAIGPNKPEFELEMNVMEALVGAVMDIEEDDCDNDSLTDLLLNNMSEEDLEENLKGDENLNNVLNSLAEEALICEAMQTVNNTKQFWEQFSRTDSCSNRSPEILDFSSSHSDEGANGSDLENLERSSPFLELKKRWDSQTSIQSTDRQFSTSSDKNFSPSRNSRTIDDFVKEDGGMESIFKVDRLKQQWEEITRSDEP